MEQNANNDFYLQEDPAYTILDSMRDSVKFAVDRTLVPYRGNLSSKSSFVDQDGNIMGWHTFGNLEGPGWAANSVGGAYEIYIYGEYAKDERLKATALSLLDHVLDDGFINHDTGFITCYRDTAEDRLCLNYTHNDEWFCAGSMAKVAYQLLFFSSLLSGARRSKMRDAAVKNAVWIETNVISAPNGWYPRRCTPDGANHPYRPEGGDDPFFSISGDGLSMIQLMIGLTEAGLADYKDRIRHMTGVFMNAGGYFGSLNHDTYDERECVCYALAFRVLRAAAVLLGDPAIRDFAYEKCLAGLDMFKITDDRNGCATKGMMFMEKSWDTAYLSETTEAAIAYLEAFSETGTVKYRDDAITLLRAMAKHHHGDYGFLTEGVDWNNHVGAVHHFEGVKYGDIKYTEPFLNNMHIVEPTLLSLKLK